ncbi:Uncharacterised protein [uncultured archaeon]|nr:Uncharacterised protein [uncultured archaeon]
MADSINPEDYLVWTKEELQKQIRILEHKIFIAQKRSKKNQDKINAVLEELKKAFAFFSAKNFIEAEKKVIDIKKVKNEIINNMDIYDHTTYFFSSWGLVPILTAISTIIISFGLILSNKVPPILDFVPAWAPLTAVIGASVQILVGVINDYKEDGMISKYKSLWYFVLPFVGFVFGFMAFLLIQAGLININMAQFNQSVNLSQSPALSGKSPIEPNAFTIIICFLAGYATDWFMGVLGKLAPAK